jgi:hypothetical protein
MSAGAYSRVPVRAAGDGALSRTALRVLVALGKFADGGGRAWPSLATLASLTGVDRRKMPGCIAELERSGYVTRTRKRDAAGDFTSNDYVIQYSDGVAPPQVTPSTSRGDTRSTSRDDTVSPPQGTRGVTSPGALSIPVSEDAQGTSHLRSPHAESGDAKIIDLGKRKARQKPPHHVVGGATKESYQPDAAELDYLRSTFKLSCGNLDLELVNWRSHDHKRPPKNLRDSFRKWMVFAEKIARARSGGQQSPPERGASAARSGSAFDRVYGGAA